jgi:nucleoside-diphosphate-sugar epimerase
VDSTHEGAMLLALPSDPSDLYSLTKLAGEALCLTDPRSTTRVARLSNVYGINMPEATFLGGVLHQGYRTGKVMFQQSPASARDYVSVAAVARLLPAIASTGRHRLYNIAAGSNTDITSPRAAIPIMPTLLSVCAILPAGKLRLRSMRRLCATHQ